MLVESVGFEGLLTYTRLELERERIAGIWDGPPGVTVVAGQE